MIMNALVAINLSVINKIVFNIYLLFLKQKMNNVFSFSLINIIFYIDIIINP